MVTGVMAPSSVNGVTMTAWPSSASASAPSDIASSSLRGEFTLILPMSPGRVRISFKLMPRAKASIWAASFTRPAPIGIAEKILSVRERFAR